MILKSFYLNLDRQEYGNDIGYKLQCQARSLCHFLGKYVKPSKFKCDFRRVVVCGKRHITTSCYINSSNVACVNIEFDLEKYSSLSSDNEINDFLIEMLIHGLKILKENQDLPWDVISEGIEEFKSNGYKNQWTHKKRLFRDYGIRAQLDCDLTVEKFSLALKITKDKNLVYDKTVLETDADEVAFDYRFKDIIIDNDKLIITSKRCQNLIAIPINEL